MNITLCTQYPGKKGAVIPQETEPDCLWVFGIPQQSRGLTVACHSVTCTDSSSTVRQCLLAQVLLYEVAISPLTGQYGEGTQSNPSAENWVKYLLNMALPTRARPVFPTTSPSHQVASQASYPHLLEGRQNANHKHSLQNEHMDQNCV